MHNTAAVKGNWRILPGSLLVVFLSIEVVLLTLQNRKLKETLRTATPLGQFESLQPGDHVPPIKLQSMGGSTVELPYDDSSREYLLFVFSTTCPHCVKNLPTWQAISDSAKGHDLSVLGISIHDITQTRDYVLRTNPHFYVAAAETTFGRQYKITGVPVTVLITGRGVVEKTWMGELTAEDSREIERLVAEVKPLAD